MNFFQEYIINNYLFIQLIPVFAGVYVINKLEKEYKLFLWILIGTFFLEIFKQYYGKHINYGQNRIWTNLYNIIYFSFLFWIFYKKTNSVSFKRIILSILFLYFLSLFCEVCVLKLNYYKNTQVLPYIIGGVGVIICVFINLINIINSKSIIYINSDFLFWFMIAHFIYFLAFVPLKISENYFSLSKDFNFILKIKIGATLLKSILLSIGFLWTTLKQEKL